MKYLIIILFCLVSAFQFNLNAQDSAVSDRALLIKLGEFVKADTWDISYDWNSAFYEYALRRNPLTSDTLNSEKYKGLISSGYDISTYVDYYALAYSLRELGRNEEAEKMFLNILRSGEAYFNVTYYNGRDYPEDTTESFGYGGYSFKYKHGACINLCKIKLEEKQFEDALKYIRLADTEYSKSRGCGTGWNIYRKEIEGLYSLAYDGMEMYDSIVNMFLPVCMNSCNRQLINAIRHIYTKTEIDSFLRVAEMSLTCEPDSFQSEYTVIHFYGEANQYEETVHYTGAQSSALIFGIRIEIPVPQLKEGETASREMFLKELRRSTLFRNLRQ